MTDHQDPTSTDATTDVSPASKTGGLGALFAAASKQADKANAPKQGKAGFDQHTKRVHMPPRGTRRSMGKR